MSNMIQQLATFAPALVAQLKGNPDALAEFTRGYQQTLEQQNEQRRRDDLTRMQGEDRTLARERETRLTTEHTKDRARQQMLQGQQDALTGLAVPGQLAELGATAQSPDDAKALIESVMPRILEGFGPSALAYGQPAVEMATRTITGRQKKAVEAYVDSALKTSFVADNPDHDPELAQLPEHIAKIVGKPTAKLSELQTFAQLPVGKPQGKTRTPAAMGSFEEFSDPATTPERKAAIAADRKTYMQSDDRAPRVTVNTNPGGLPPSATNAALKFQDDYARDSKPYLLLRDAYQRVKAAKPDAAGDLSLIFAYMKILDPNSVVREQEFANAQNAAGVPDRIRNVYNQTMEGVRLNPEQRAQFLSQAEALFENAKTNQRQVRGTYGNRAKQWGIPENMVLDEEDPMLTSAPTAKKPAAPSERRVIKGQLAEWDGKGWKPVPE